MPEFVFATLRVGLGGDTTAELLVIRCYGRCATMVIVTGDLDFGNFLDKCQ